MVMKRNMMIFAAVALFVSAVSCTKSETPETSGESRFLVVVDKVIPAVEASRAVFTDGVGISWQAEDASRFCAVDGDGARYVAESVSIADDGKATFAFSSAPSDGQTVHFFYGLDEELSHSFSLSQTQDALGSINPENLCFSSSAVTVSGNSCSPSMSLVGEVVRFLVYSSTGKYSSEKIESVSLVTEETVAGKCVYSADGGTSLSGQPGSVTVTLSSPSAVSATDRDGTLGYGIYMSIAPSATLSSAYSYVITTDRARYTLSYPQGTAFADGTVRNIPVDLEKASVVREERTMELYVPGAVDIGNYIKLGEPGAFDAYTTISVSFWFKGAEKLNIQRQGSIISNFISDGSFYGWEINTWASDDNGNGSYRLRVSRAFGGNDLREPSNDFPDYTGWHHIAYTFDNSTHYTALYLDGNKIGDDTFDAAPKQPGYGVQMCAFKSLTDAGNPKSVSGSIRNLRFWERALSADEVAADMTAEVTGSEEGLIAAWDFTWKPEDASNVLDKTGKHSAQILGDQIEWIQK